MYASANRKDHLNPALRNTLFRGMQAYSPHLSDAGNLFVQAK